MLLLLLWVGFALLGGPQRVVVWVTEQRCTSACETYMRGEPGARWVSEFGDGPGYNAMLACLNDAMQMQVGLDCWPARVHACSKACVAAELDPDQSGS